MAIIDVIKPFLSDDDDPSFWKHAIEILVTDVEYEIANGGRNRNICMNIGACSHWLRPHQTRWTAAGGFAYPAGYGKFKASFGVPEFDWSVDLFWDQVSQNWKGMHPRKHHKWLTFRAALPTRTSRHRQAAIHTVWQPGSPTVPREKRVRLYGFRRQQQAWHCVATSK